jgi:hypothetical protein
MRDRRPAGKAKWKKRCRASNFHISEKANVEVSISSKITGRNLLLAAPPVMTLRG